MKRYLCMILGLSLMLLSPLAAANGQDLEKIEAIARLNQMWDEALVAGDVAALLSLVTDDYIRLLPNESANGKAKFQQFCEAGLKLCAFKNSQRVIKEIRLADGWAYVRGTWSAIIVPANGEDAYPLTVDWMNICELQPDGSYKVSQSCAPMTLVNKP